jgi:Ca2+-binding RTX toxin-like protein
MATLQEYAQLSGRVYYRTDENRTPVPEGWTEISWLDDDPITGFSAGAYKNGNDIVIAFTGTNEGYFEDFALANIPAGIGLASPQILQAAGYVLDIMAQNPGASISFTGHSLGGGLASVMAVFFDKSATIFDPAPFQATAVNPILLIAIQDALIANGYNNTAFNDYVLSFGTLFYSRESNVKSYYLDGEILEPLRALVPVIAGEENVVSAGNQSIVDTIDLKKLAAGMTTLHSMTLLNDMLLSSQFSVAIQSQPYALEVFTDSTLYATDPQTSNIPDFLNNMLIKAVGDPNNAIPGSGILDELGADMLRISQPQEIIRGVLAVLTEYYQYLDAASLSPFIEGLTSGIRFDLTSISGDSDGRGQKRLYQQLQTWLQANGETWLPLSEANRITLQQGEDALNVDMSGDSKNDLAIGGIGDDQISGGDGNDVLIGLGGSDTLYGGAGNDYLSGGLGNDVMIGGDGFDIYIINNNDIVIDSDGYGVIKDSEGNVIDGYIEGSNLHAGDTIIPVILDTNLTLTFSDGSSVEIDNFHDGDFGIKLTQQISTDFQSYNTITGDQNPDPNDTLYDTDANDLILAGDGDDIVYKQYAGDDVIDLGAGDDEFQMTSAATGRVSVFGGDGRDYMGAGSGQDIIQGGEGADALYGSGESDLLYGDLAGLTSDFIAQGAVEAGTGLQGEWVDAAPGDDQIFTGADNDLIAGGDGSDLIVTGGGTDWIWGDWDSYSVDTAAWQNWSVNETATTDGNGNTTYSYEVSNIYTENNDGIGDDLIYSGSGDDVVFGERGNDTVYLEGGDDKAWGGEGNDILTGGDGNDKLNGDNSIDVLAETLHGNDILDGGDGDDELYGMGGSDRLFGGIGADKLYGDGAGILMAGDDYLDGGDGNDLLNGGGGADVLLGGTGNDEMYGESSDIPANIHGDDYLDGGTGDDTMFGGGGNDTLLGGDGLDIISADDGDDYVDGGADNDTITGGAGNDTILGGAGDDIIMGEADNDVLFGGDGMDELQGGIGDDSLYGEGDDDTLFGQDGSDTLYGGDGIDNLVGGIGDDILYGDAGDDNLWGEDGNDTLSGGAGNDILSGGAGDDTYYFNVGDGVDWIYEQDAGSLDVLNLGGGVTDYEAYRTGNNLVLDGLNGMDALVVADWFYGSSSQLSLINFADGTTWTSTEASTNANYILKGTDQDDYIYGDSTSQNLSGLGGNDYISAGDGDDIITGGTGDDTLIGGNGNDTYIFNLGDGHDVINNADAYGAGTDTLVFGMDFLPADMIYDRVGNDLVISHFADLGTIIVADSITVTGWFNGSTYQLDSINFDADPAAVLSAQQVSDLATLKNHYYQFSLGDGSVSIEDWGGQDVITFDANISPNDITPVRSGNDLVFSHVNGTDQLTVIDWFNDQMKQIEQIDFLSDSTVWLADDITAPLLNLAGTPGNDYLVSGDAYGETIEGFDGVDVLYGNGGNDTLIGGTGNDELYGGAGSDLYIFNAGDGQDVVGELSESWPVINVLRFESNVDPDLITSTISGSSLKISYGSGDEILISGYYNYNSPAYHAKFKYESIIDGTSGNDIITGSDRGALTVGDFYGGDVIYGYAGDDVINAGGGNDTVYGGDGNDTIYVTDTFSGSDHLFGEAGNDTLGELYGLYENPRNYANGIDFSGGTGDDIIYGTNLADVYIYNAGDGNDIIYEQPYRDQYSGDYYCSREDEIQFGEGITPDAISFDKVNNDLVLTLSPTDSITLVNWFYTSGAYYAVDYFKFYDGTTLNKDDVKYKVFEQIGTEGNDTLNGDNSYGDALYGLGGDDILNGNGGADILDGGAGNDLLNGGSDSDTYIFGRGYGYDVIYDNIAGYYSNNKVKFDDGISALDISYSRDTDNLVLTIIDSGDQLVISNFFGSEYFRKIQFDFTDNSTLPQNQAIYDEFVYLTGDESANTLVGSEGYDVITGNGGDDILIGNGGDDVINGNDGSDILNGGLGNDTLSGGEGGDTYQYSLGDGSDTIDNYDLDTITADIIWFDASITTNDVTAHRLINDDLILEISDGGQIQILDHFVSNGDSGNAIDEVRFYDGTIWSKQDIQAKTLEATNGGDYLYGYDTDETLSGLAGNDTIIGNGGDDVLSGDDGSDILDGGTGNDSLSGGAGSDIYRFGFGYGNDIVDNLDSSSSRYDKIEFLSDVKASDVRISRVGDDLVLTLTSTGDQITVTNHFVTTGKIKDYYIDAVTFSDGIVWSRADIDGFIALNPDGNYTLTGTSGDDALLGYGGNDILVGGAGNDTLDGGAGNDTYRYSLGDGNDVITNYDTGAGRMDVIELAPGIAVSDVITNKIGDDFVLNMPDGGSITITNYFAGYATAGYAVDEIRFDDGTVWSISDVLQMMIPDNAPVATDDAGTTSEDNAIIFLVADLLANDSDADGDPLSITDVVNALNGSAVFDDVAGTITFTPDADYYGPASFEYVVSDGMKTDTAVVNIDVTPVDDAPIAQDDSVQATQDTTLVINAVDLLVNDIDVDGDALSLVSVQNTLNGTVVYDNVAGTITFTPTPGYTGNASFDYTMTDGTSNSSASVLVDVLPPNTAPVAVDDNVATTQDNSVVVNVADVLANDTDADGDTLQVTGVQNPVNGSVSFDQVAGTITFTPDPYYDGPAQFEYLVSDGIDQDVGMVNVDVVLDTSGGRVGTDGADTLRGTRSDDYLYGLGGDDVIIAKDGNDTLIGGAGNDTMSGDDGNDIYVSGIGDGMDIIDNSTSGTSDYDILHMVGGDPYSLWFSQSGNDLVIDVVGTNDQVLVQGWYAGTSNELDEIDTANSVLINGNVDQLVSAMAAFSVPSGEGAIIPQAVRDQIDPVIAASWQSA